MGTSLCGQILQAGGCCISPGQQDNGLAWCAWEGRGGAFLPLPVLLPTDWPGPCWLRVTGHGDQKKESTNWQGCQAKGDGVDC